MIGTGQWYSWAMLYSLHVERCASDVLTELHCNRRSDRYHLPAPSTVDLWITIAILLFRVKHKQELAAMKQELTKLQQESKSGQKSKDVAAKELEATKKKLQDIEAKLKAAVTDKQTALQVRHCAPC